MNGQSKTKRSKPAELGDNGKVRERNDEGREEMGREERRGEGRGWRGGGRGRTKKEESKMWQSNDFPRTQPIPKRDYV